MAEGTFNLNNINVGMTIKSYLRILKLTKKPSRDEFLIIAKVAGIGILFIGFIGFIIYVLLTEMPKWM
ncbi:MAG TPA: protein translocase SEC61 complex subunit gamma [Methanosarcinaceae archaeon]|nr:protein translocase SEC61 complex subunit gamma [Methanosarcinaceae archaeon]